MGKNMNEQGKRVLINEDFYITVPEGMKYTQKDTSFDNTTVLCIISEETTNGKKASFKNKNNSIFCFEVIGTGAQAAKYSMFDPAELEYITDPLLKSMGEKLGTTATPKEIRPDSSTLIYYNSRKIDDKVFFFVAFLMDDVGMYMGIITVNDSDKATVDKQVRNILMSVTANTDGRGADEFTEVKEPETALPPYDKRLLKSSKPLKAYEDISVNVRGDFSIKVPEDMLYSVNENLIGGHRAFVCISPEKNMDGKTGDVSEPFGYMKNLSIMKTGHKCPSFESDIPRAFFQSYCAMMHNELNADMPIKLFKAEKDIKVYYVYPSTNVVKQCSFMIFCSGGEIYAGTIFSNDAQMTQEAFNKYAFDWMDSIKREKMQFDNKEAAPDFSKLNHDVPKYYCANGTADLIKILDLFSEDVLFYKEYTYKNKHHGHGKISLNPESGDRFSEFILYAEKLIPNIEMAIDFLENEDALRIPLSNQTAKMKRFMNLHDITGTTLFEFAQWHMLFVFEDKGNYTVYVEKNIADCVSKPDTYIRSMLDAIRKYNGISGKYDFKCHIFYNIEDWNEESEKTEIFENIGVAQLPDGVMGYTGNGNFCGVMTADAAKKYGVKMPNNKNGNSSNISSKDLQKKKNNNSTVTGSSQAKSTSKEELAQKICGILCSTPMTATEISDVLGEYHSALEIFDVVKCLKDVETTTVVREYVNKNGGREEKLYKAYLSKGHPRLKNDVSFSSSTYTKPDVAVNKALQKNELITDPKDRNPKDTSLSGYSNSNDNDTISPFDKARRLAEKIMLVLSDNPMTVAEISKAIGENCNGGQIQAAVNQLNGVMKTYVSTELKGKHGKKKGTLITAYMRCGDISMKDIKQTPVSMPKASKKEEDPQRKDTYNEEQIKRLENEINQKREEISRITTHKTIYYIVSIAGILSMLILPNLDSFANMVGIAFVIIIAICGVIIAFYFKLKDEFKINVKDEEAKLARKEEELRKLKGNQIGIWN